MKKYLIKGLLALVVGGFTASCADKDGEYVPMDQQKEAAYADVFKELIGGEVAPNHDWGFKKTSLIDESSQARTSTRTADVNSNEWVAKGYNVPGEISQRERDVVMQWFRTHENPQSETVDIHNYFIQNVGYTDHTYPGEGVELKDNNGHDVTITNPGRTQMDYIFVGPGYYSNDNGNTTIAYNWDNGDDHVNNFNAGSGQIQHIIYSGSEYFGFHDSYGAGVSTEGHGNNGKYCEKNRNFVIRFIEVDGVVGCYVGFNYESGKTSEGWHLEPDGFFDDRVIKLVAAEGEIVPPTPGGGSSTSSTTTRTDRIERSRLVAQGRVFCEDLGTDVVKMDLTDIDFNDAVFDAKIWRMGQFDITYIDNTYNSESDYLENIYTTGINGFDIETTGGDAHVIVNGKFKYVAEICILAAGGTIPLKIGGNNGFEIHEKFGVGHTTIVNTMGEPSGEKVNIMVTSVTRDAVTINVDITDLVKAAIEKGNTDISLDIIPIEVLWTNGEYRGVSVLQAESENDIRIAPQKLCVPIGTPWVYERIPITSAYADFASYAKSKTPLFWEGSTNRNPSLLYASGPAGLSEETNETGNVGTNPFHDEIVVQGETITTTEVETEVWTTTGLALSGWSNNAISNKTIFANITADHTIRIYGYRTNPDNWGGLQMFTGNWKKLKEDFGASYSEDNFASGGYVEYSNISDDLASALQHDTEGGSCILQGDNYTVTKITIVLTNTQRQ